MYQLHQRDAAAAFQPARFQDGTAGDSRNRCAHTHTTYTRQSFVQLPTLPFYISLSLFLPRQEYEREGILWKFISFPDNQDVVSVRR